MKKQFVMGMMLSLTLSAPMAFAAGAKGAEAIRSEISKNDKRALEKDAISALKGLVRDAEVLDRSSTILSKIAGGADSTELKSSLSRKIKVATVDGEKQVAVLDVAKSIMKADQTTKEINRNDLTAEGKSHLELVEEAVKVSSEFLTLANRTSDMSASTNELAKQASQALNKQIALIPEMLTKMDTADLKGHVEVMKKAIQSRTSPSMNGDQAYLAALKTEGMSAEKLKEKLEEIIGCI